MKSCPTCNRTYPDDTLAFCLMDGSVLSAPFDPAESRQRRGTPERAPVTEVLSPPTQRVETPPQLQSTLHAAVPPPVFHPNAPPREIAGAEPDPSLLLRATFAVRGSFAIFFGLYAIVEQNLHGLAHPFVYYAIIAGLLGITCGLKTYLDYRSGTLLILEGVFNLGFAAALWFANYYTVYARLIPPVCIVLGAVFQIGAAAQLRKKINGVWPLALSGATSLLFGGVLFIVLIFVVSVWHL